MILLVLFPLSIVAAVIGVVLELLDYEEAASYFYKTGLIASGIFIVILIIAQLL